MFQTILVPLDGSARAERALPVAARLVRASGGSIVLLQVVSPANEPWPYVSSTAEPMLSQAAVESDLANAERYLAGLTVSSDLEGVETETVALFGPTAPTILSVAYSYTADVIIMCSHGYTGVTRWVMGSVAEKVVRHAAVPVLILREGGPIPGGPHPDATRPLRVLVPLDGSAYAKAALAPAAAMIAALAVPAQGAMHLTRVVRPPTHPLVGSEQELHEQRKQLLHKAKVYLSTTAEHLHEGLVAPSVAHLNLPITWSVAFDADVASAIIRVAENGEDAEGAGVFGGCDMIAMATHGRSGLQHWAMGSIAERVLNATRLPLLIVRPSDMIVKSSHAGEQVATIV